MVLNRRYRRNIKKNLSFYISIVILTAVIVMVYMTMSCGFESMEAYLDEFKKENVMEDAQFTTFLDLEDSAIEELEDKYDLVIEEHNQIEVSAGEDTIRVLKDTKDINQHRIMEGKEPKQADEIAFSTSYLENNDVAIGDTIELEDAEYKIVGAFGRPDYLYVLQELRGSFATPETFGLGLLSEEGYDNLKETRAEDETKYYSVKYGDTDIDKFRKELNDTAMVSGYVSKDNNNRISTADSTLEMTEAIKDVLMPIIFVFVTFIVAVVLERKIKSEKKMIGILSALGYSRKRLAAHYSIFGVIAALLGSILGIILSVPMQNVLIPMAFVKLESFPVTYGLQLSGMIISLLLPLIAYTLSIYLTAYFMMRKDTVAMLNDAKEKESKTSFRMANSKLGFVTKFKIRSVFGRPSRTFIIIIGICIGSIIFLYTLGVVDSLKIFVDESVDKIGEVEYQYYLNEIRTQKPEEGVPVIAASCEAKSDNTSITLMGMEENDLLNTSLVNGEKADLGSGKYYITSMGATMYKLDAGDTITVRNIASLEETRIEISGIVDNDCQNIIYTSTENVCEILGVEDGSYNLVLSKEKIDYADSELNQIITKSSYTKQIQTVYDLVKSEVGIMLPFGVIICVCVIYIMVNMLITENETSISMLKVLGYKDKEINRIVIMVYHFIIPIAAVLGIGVSYMFVKSYLVANINAFNSYLATHFTVKTILEYFLLVAVSYVISLWILKNKVKRIGMAESLKANRD